MKIRDFIKETAKKLKKHSYDAQSIMESTVEHGESVYNYTIKEKNNIPDYFYNEHTDEYIFKKQYPKDNADDDFDDIKNGDILLIDFEVYGRIPLWIHKIYEAFSGTMVALRHYEFLQSSDGERSFNGENEVKYQLNTLKYLNRKGKIIFYKKESPKYNIVNDGSDFDEPLNEEFINKDESKKDGIIDVDGKKYYKVDLERHINSYKDIEEYLVPGQTIFVYNKISGVGKRIFFYKEWKPKKYKNFIISSEPFEITMIEKGKEGYELKLEIYSLYGYLKNDAFNLYISEELASNKNIKDEWELTSGEEYDDYYECKNLKRRDLETLKEGTIISGKNNVKILNKKGNYYNVISEGKKYKYDINDLKYNYTHNKIKIFESLSKLEKQAKIYGFPDGFITENDLYYRKSAPDDLFSLQDVNVNNYVKLQYIEVNDEYPDFELISWSNLKRLYDMGRLKKIDTSFNELEYED